MVRARLWDDGCQISVGPNGLAFGSMQRRIEWHNLTFVAMYFSFDEFEEGGPDGGSLRLRRVPNPKYGTGKLWSGTDPDVVTQALEYLAAAKADAGRAG